MGATWQTSGVIFDQQGNALTVKRAFVNIAAGQTAASVVAAVTGKKIRVIALAMVAGGTATNATFNSTSGAPVTTAISCLFANAANGGACLGEFVHGWFETVSGEALTVTTGAGSTTGIQVAYIEVP